MRAFRRRYTLFFTPFLAAIFLVIDAAAQSFEDQFYDNPPQAFDSAAARITGSDSLSGCMAAIKELNHAIPRLRLIRLDGEKWLDFNSEVPEQNPRFWMAKLRDGAWGIQMELRRRMKEAVDAEELSNEAKDEFRELGRLLRFVRDFASVYLSYDPALPKRSKEPEFFGDMEGFDYQPGDIIITRGPSPISSVIPRLPQEKQDGHFSHALFISRDENGELIAIESLLETGVRLFSIEELKKRKSTRGALLRHPNPQVAMLAADLMYDRVKNGPYIPYDYEGSGPREGYDRYQCIHVPQIAFQWAYEKLGFEVGSPHNQYPIPLFPTYIDNLAPIAGQIGLDPSLPWLLTPDAFWYQLDFNVVGEWSYPHSLPDVMFFDVTADRLFEWSREEQLRLTTMLRHRVLARLAVIVAKLWDHLPKKLQKRIPRDMPYDSMTVAFSLLKVIGTLKKELNDRSDQYLEINDGIPLSWSDAIRALDAIREELEKNPRSAIQLLVPNEPE